MRSALCSVLLCGVAFGAAAQEREVIFEETPPVSITGFAVGRADYDRVARTNGFTAGKVGVSLFKPAGDAYVFAQLTTALDGSGEAATEIDNLLVSWTPRTANQWTVAFGRFDAPIGFERDDEPLNLIPTNSFNFSYARPGKLTGVQVHYTASPRLDLWAVAANGWDVAVDNNRGKTALARAQFIPIPWVTVGVTGVYGPEQASTDRQQRSLLSSDLTVDRGPLILGAELNLGRERTSHGHAANSSVRDGGPNVVLEQCSRRNLQQHRAHALPSATDRAARRRSGRLVVPAVLRGRKRCAAGRKYHGRTRARLRLLGGETLCRTTCDAPTPPSSGSSPACSPRSACPMCSAR